MPSEDLYHLDTKVDYLDTKAQLENEFRLWKVTEAKITRSKDGSVTVEWFPHESTTLRVMRSGDQSSAASNIRKIYLIINALRLNERRGFAEYMREFYLQLPAGRDEGDPYKVLGVTPDAPLEDIEAMYRSKARRLHPDAANEDGTAMAALNAAMDRIRQEKRGAA